MGLFRGRVDFSADYFYNRRSDILLQRETVSNVSGLRVKAIPNFGIVRNQGVDANLILKQKVGNVDLSARGNLTYAKIRSLNETKSLRNTVIRHIQETPSTNHYCILRKDFILRMISILQQTEYGGQTYKLKDGLPTPAANVAPGDIKYKDLNNDGVIDSYDRTFMIINTINRHRKLSMDSE